MVKRKLRVEDVFTPSIQAVITFVERDSYTTNILVDSLRTPGKQVVLYGHSGSGKSTLLKNKLNQVYEHRVLITRCMKEMTYESLVLNAFDQLDQYFLEEASSNKSKKFTASFSMFTTIKAFNDKFEIEFAKSSEEKYKRLLPPQLTAQKLAQFMGELKACWVIEDLHKMPVEAKAKFSQAMKIFVDCSVDYPHLKIIALGALNSARQVIQYDPEMNNRISEIYVGLMKDTEIEEIVSKGENLLNLFISKEVKDIIVRISNGLPSITHQLCLNICFSKDIYETQDKTVFIDQQEFVTALRRYIDERSDSIKRDFDRAVRPIDKDENANHQNILKAAISTARHEFTSKDVLVHTQKSGLELNTDTVVLLLNNLCTEERGGILTLDENSQTYSFSNYFIRSYSILRIETEHHEVIDSKSKLKDVLINMLVQDGFFADRKKSIDDAELL